MLLVEDDPVLVGLLHRLLGVFAAADTLGAVDTYVYYLRRELGHAVIRNVRGLGCRAGEIS